MFFETKIASAQTFSKVAANPAVNSLVTKIVNAIVVPVMQGLFILTVLLFIWGLLGMFIHGEDSKERGRAQNHVLWGTIGMAIIASVFGIIRLIGNTVGVGDPFL